MKRIILLASIAFLAVSLYAVDSVTVKAMGFGSSYDAAVQSALKDAVRKVNGSAFRGDTTVKGRSSQMSATRDGTEVNDSRITEDVTDDFREVLKGVVLGHRVESCEPDAQGYKVSLEVDVAKYIPPMISNQQKVAIAPLKYTLTGFQIGGDSREFFKPAQLVTEELGSRMTTYVVQSGRFSVLSREDEDVLKAEEKVISEGAPVAEMVKIGQRLGADFLVVGTLRNVYVSGVTTQTSRLTGVTRSMLSRASLNMTYRVLVVSTAQIAYMENVDIDLNPQELSACGGSPELAFRTLLERAAQKVGCAFFADFKRNIPQSAAQKKVSEGTTIVTPQVNVNIVVPPAPVQGGIRLPGDK